MHDSLWLQSADRLYLLRLNGWPHSTLLKKYESLGGPITYLQNGQVLLGTPDGIGRLDPRDQYQSINSYYSFAGKNRVNNLFTEGAFTWVSTNDGIFLFESDKPKLHLTPANGLPSSLIKDVMKDNEQNYWVATDRGLVLFNDTINKTFLNANDRSVFVNGITIDSTGSVWCIRDNAQN